MKVGGENPIYRDVFKCKYTPNAAKFAYYYGFTFNEKKMASHKNWLVSDK